MLLGFCFLFLLLCQGTISIPLFFQCLLHELLTFYLRYWPPFSFLHLHFCHNSVATVLEVCVKLLLLIHMLSPALFDIGGECGGAGCIATPHPSDFLLSIAQNCSCPPGVLCVRGLNVIFCSKAFWSTRNSLQDHWLLFNNATTEEKSNMPLQHTRGSYCFQYHIES